MKNPNLQFQPGLSLSEFIATYGTEEQCETVLEKSRWPSDEVITVTDSPIDSIEEGIVVPLDRITPDTLRNLIGEFVTREWSDLSDAGISFETKIAQVLKQLEEQQILVVYDLTSETCNIVPVDHIAK